MTESALSFLNNAASNNRILGSACNIYCRTGCIQNCVCMEISQCKGNMIGLIIGVVLGSLILISICIWSIRRAMRSGRGQGASQNVNVNANIEAKSAEEPISSANQEQAPFYPTSGYSNSQDYNINAQVVYAPTSNNANQLDEYANQERI